VKQTTKPLDSIEKCAEESHDTIDLKTSSCGVVDTKRSWNNHNQGGTLPQVICAGYSMLEGKWIHWHCQLL